MTIDFQFNGKDAKSGIQAVELATARLRIVALEHELEIVHHDRASLNAALEYIIRIAERGDVNIQPLLMPILDVARSALARKPE